MRYLRSLTIRMVLSHMLIATLTCIITMVILVLVLIKLTQVASIEHYQALARETVDQWQFNDPQGQPNALGLPSGFGLVIAPDDTILFSRGETPCRVGMRLRDCAAELVDRPMGAEFFTRNGQRWGEVVQPTATGQRVIVQYGPLSGEPSLMLADVIISGTVPFLLVITGAMLVISVPLSLVLAWQDEIGALAQQFDAMADTLGLNMSILRDLAERNAELARQVEQSAIQAERMRLSRDLHDDIAQHLFSLTIRAATLPDLIERDPIQGKAQAQTLAALAEQALLSLRTILIELRPSALLVRVFPEALQALCNDWQITEHIGMEYSVVLSGQRLPSMIEDVLYRTVQEALHNVAKHAHATSAAVSLVESRRQITVSITDDGQGFEPSHVPSVGHLGIVSMRERAHAVGGNLSIESERARGTTVRLTLPIESEKESML